MSYVTVKTSISLNPEYFRAEALRFNANPTDRKQWLQRQLINLQSSLGAYGAQMQQLVEQGAQLDGKNTTAQWLTGIGGVAVVIPTIPTQIAGAVLTVAGIIVGAIEKGKDSKALQQLQGRARELQLEVIQIKAYYDQYNAELQKINLMPIALLGAAAFIIAKK